MFSHLHYTPAVHTNEHFINEWIIAHHIINGQFCLNLEINRRCCLFTQKLRTEMFFFEYERRNKERSQRESLEDRFIISFWQLRCEFCACIHYEKLAADRTGASCRNCVAKNSLQKLLTAFLIYTLGFTKKENTHKQTSECVWTLVLL